MYTQCRYHSLYMHTHIHMCLYIYIYIYTTNDVMMIMMIRCLRGNPQPDDRRDTTSQTHLVRGI